MIDRHACWNCFYGRGTVESSTCIDCFFNTDRPNWVNKFLGNKEIEMKKNCGNCKETNCIHYGRKSVCGAWGKELPQTGITFPILNNLTPTTESCTMKVIEEVGELMQMIGKEQRKSGEELCYAGRKRDWAIDTIQEALDTAQAAVTMAVQLCKEYEVSIEDSMTVHNMKLREKGYLK